MKIFTFKNLAKVIEIAFQAWIFIILLSPETQDVSVADRIQNLKKLKKWMDDGNDPSAFSID